MLLGQIKFFDARRGYGFVTLDATNPTREAFFHSSAIVSTESDAVSLRRGDAVRVGLPADPDDAARAGGRPEATRIERIDAASEPATDDGADALFAARRAAMDRERASE